MSQKAVSYVMMKPCHIATLLLFLCIFIYTQLWHNLHTICERLQIMIEQRVTHERILHQLTSLH